MSSPPNYQNQIEKPRTLENSNQNNQNQDQKHSHNNQSQEQKQCKNNQAAQKNLPNNMPTTTEHDLHHMGVEQHYDNVQRTPGEHDLFAATTRVSRPPPVATSDPYKETLKARTAKTINKNATPAVKSTTAQDIHTSIPTSQPGPSTSYSQVPMINSQAGPSYTTNPPVYTNTSMVYNPEVPERVKVKKVRRKTTAPKIEYDICQDVLSQKVNMNVGELVTVAPNLKRQLIKTCQKLGKRIVVDEATRTTPVIQAPTSTPMDLAYVEDGDIDTTALNTTVCINNHPITSVIDTGSAKTCISKQLADRLGLEIDAVSYSVFTLGNGTKQPALGIIYGVPLQFGDLTIPCALEVLPYCPTNLLIGNNFLHRAKAKINLDAKTVRLLYKNAKVTFPIAFGQVGPDIHFKIKTVTRPNYKIQSMIKNKQITTTTQVSNNRDEENDSSEDEYEEISTDEEVLENDDMYETASDSDEYTEQDLMYCNDNDNLQTELKAERFLKFENSSDECSYDISVKEQIIIPPYSTIGVKLNANHMFVISKETSPHLKCIFTMINNVFVDCGNAYDLIDNKILLTNSLNTDLVLEPNTFLGVGEHIYEDSIEKTYAVEMVNTKKIIQESQENFLACNINDSDMSTPAESTHVNEPILSPEHQEKLDLNDVPEGIKEATLKLLYKYKDIFDWDNDKIGCLKDTEYKITLKNDAVPFRARPYRLSPEESDGLQLELQKFLQLGLIKEVDDYCDWASPIILVKKKDNSYRMVADLRKLNQAIKVPSHPIPRIDDLIDTLGQAKLFSSFDLRSGFFQVKLAEESQRLTTFITKFGTTCYTRLPQGLAASPNFFMLCIERAFKTLLNNCVVAYLDDVTAYSDENCDNHLQVLEKVFKCVQDSGMLLNPAKTKLFTPKIPFLGVIISAEGVHTNPETVAKIKNFPAITSLKACRGFIGLASYYRRFIEGFARITRPLTNLLKTSDKAFTMTNEAQEAFETLKDKLINAPILTRADFTKPFLLCTDASYDGFGAVLSQLDDQDREHPIIYSSVTLKPNQRNWGSSKLELGCIVWAVSLYRPYLLGSHFKIKTDNTGAVGLLKTKDPKGILARWIQVLSEYDFTCTYIEQENLMQAQISLVVCKAIITFIFRPQCR